ncbi:MAG: phosphoribosylformylglycinamidine synthase subunit PurL [Candidatus Aminicenantes bacterium]|nr:phosphoribosylformylglycinamidine synthase subunit PurL [Candidatus Aminicenantes bacterium]
MIDKKILDEHNLTEKEYELIVALIGKQPNLTELGIFSLMWSEHCSYKSSRIHLKKLPVTGDRVIQGPGENAGVIDIGDGLAAVFKIESHNHPSFIEPYQGAATGAGGILRDIFTMGARPIALLDSLRFGPLTIPRNRAIMEGVVSGIAGYGNSIGVPTVGGETAFHDCYSLNPLVNVFCLGIAEKNKIFYAKAEGIGNPVLYVGSKTGRDGIHGATMASVEFRDDLEEKRPNVQVGDPFKEKLLLEACLQVMEKGLIIGIQDMGAAGLTCSTSEMASNSGAGIKIDLDLVPQREEDMTPYEIMLSESQERMLLVAKKDKVKEVQEIFTKWDLDAVVIGQVTSDGRLKVSFQGEKVVDIPVDPIVNLCPAYRRESKKPGYIQIKSELPDLPEPKDHNQVLDTLLSLENLADKEWVFRQYDHMVQINTTLLPGADASVLRIKHSKKALAVSLDGNSLYTYLDPKTGGKIAVAESCRNLACVGAYPLGVTNCLNFGNPEKPEIMWQFEEVIAGMSEACRHFIIPITGGNVSFYNETEGAAIYPTPVLGVVGMIDDIDNITSPEFKQSGDIIILLGENRNEIGASQYLKHIHNLETGPVHQIDLDQEMSVQEVCRQAIEEGRLQSAHDISEGGLAVCLAECSFLSREKIGCIIELQDDLPAHALLFGETQSRIIVTAKPENVKHIEDLARTKKIKTTNLGKTEGRKFIIRHHGDAVINYSLEKGFKNWKQAIPSKFR